MAAKDHMAEKKYGSILYPTLLIAAIAVIIFSVLGIATIMGYIPNVLSMPDLRTSSESAGSAEPENANPPNAPPAARSEKTRTGTQIGASCINCGVIESIHAVQSNGQGSGVGAVAGGVIGGILGNQFGRGSGRTAMTLVGAGAGAFTGNEVEKNMNKSVSYQVRVRMNDGGLRTIYQHSQPMVEVGQRVRVANDRVVASD